MCEKHAESLSDVYIGQKRRHNRRNLAFWNLQPGLKAPFSKHHSPNSPIFRASLTLFSQFSFSFTFDVTLIIPYHVHHIKT